VVKESDVSSDSNEDDTAAWSDEDDASVGDGVGLEGISAGQSDETVHRRMERTNYELNEVCTLKEEEPTSFAEMEKSKNRKQWLDATESELKSLKDSGTWVLTDLPPGREALKCKWLWKMEFDAIGRMTKFKARLVLKGYM
jgi:aminoglycoside phosphotransferase